MLPNFPVMISFNIDTHGLTKELWANPQARTLFLLWYPCHKVTREFYKETLLIGKNITESKPVTATELLKCFPPNLKNYQESDFHDFIYEALPYFTGEKKVEYKINLVGLK